MSTRLAATSRGAVVPTPAEAAALPSPPLPAWPVLALVWGIPAWWALGLSPFFLLLGAVPLAALLLRQQRVLLVPGIMPFIAFTLWTIPCAVMLDTSGRMFGYGLRLGQFVAICLVLVYVVNAPQSLTPRRILDALTWYWVVVITGGYLGLLFPDTRLTLTAGRLLPGSFLSNEYVADLVFPAFVEAQYPYGAEEPFLRPSAPFAYANGWGAAMAFLTPIVLGAAIYRGTRRALVLTLLGLAAAIPPAVATSNRGMFIALGIAAGYVMARLLFRGRIALVAGVAVGTGAAVAALWSAGFVDRIADRQNVVDTGAGRANLYAETLQRTLDSPLLGYGAPRPSLTSEIAAGTQGAVWNAMFSFGFVGLLLFLVFLVGAAIRTAPAPSTAALWMHASVVIAVVMGVYYGLDRLLLPIALVVALLLRERYLPSTALWSGPSRR